MLRWDDPYKGVRGGRCRAAGDDSRSRMKLSLNSLHVCGRRRRHPGSGRVLERPPNVPVRDRPQLRLLRSPPPASELAELGDGAISSAETRSALQSEAIGPA